MHVSYLDKLIETLCRSQKVAIKKIGLQSAKKLQRRLLELHAAQCVGDLVVGHPHPLAHGRNGQFAVDLHKGMRLIFKPNSELLKISVSEPINWHQVSAITIIEVNDYHD